MGDSNSYGRDHEDGRWDPLVESARGHYERAEEEAVKKIRRIVREEMLAATPDGGLTQALTVKQVGMIAIVTLRGIQEVHIVGADERHGSVAGTASTDADAHGHVPVPPGVSESRGEQPRPDRGDGDVVGDGGVHPGVRPAEHRESDGRTPETKVHVEGPDPSPEDLRMVAIPIRLAAALAMKCDHTSFGPSDKGMAAQSAIMLIQRRLDRLAPYWRTELWPKQK